MSQRNLLPKLYPCSAQTRSGHPCINKSEYPDRPCVLHDPTREEERSAQARERGKKGYESLQEKLKLVAEQQNEVAKFALLDTATKIRQALETEIVNVRNAPRIKAAVRAQAIARLCSVALQCLVKLQLEEEVLDLRKQIEELRLQHVNGTNVKRIKLTWADQKKEV